MNRKLMRTFQFAALALTAFGATMTVKAPEANAVVYCAAGVYRAGCVARPVAAPTVNGVARRTARLGVRSDATLTDGALDPSRTLPFERERQLSPVLDAGLVATLLYRCSCCRTIRNGLPPYHAAQARA